ncbi:MAG: 4Fe-4S binding protein [Chloroflexi bacterium]|nr:4Fe-4S binding protein [Chloroflexota bacterium]
MKTQTIRAWSRILLLFLVTIHLVTWYVLGTHAVGSIGIEALFSGLSRGVLNTGFVFWMLVLMSVLLFGRAFCAWFCWFGGYLDLVEWGIGDKLKFKLPHTLPLHLAVIPFVALFAKVYGSLLVNWLNGVPATLTFNAADTEPWGGQQTGISILITFVLYGPVLLYFFGRHAWCRYLCPIGALLKIFNRIGIGKVRLVNQECNGCGKCNRLCEMQVDVLGNLKDHGQVNSADCIRCLKCTDGCPTGAIAFRMQREKGVSLNADAASRAVKTSFKRRRKSAFDMTVAVLWIGVTIFFTFTARQGAPQELKVTMAAGLLLVCYGLVWMMQKGWYRFGRKGRETW